MRLEDDIKQKEFRSEYHKGIINVMYTFNWLDSHSTEFFKTYDLTTQQFNILRILRGQHPKPSTINLLKERMLDKMCDASRMVERLRKKDLVERKTSEVDRRSVDIVITKKGLDLLKKIDKALPEFENIMNHLTLEEVKKLNSLLDKMRG